MAVVGEAGKQVQHLSSTTGHDCQQALWMIIVLPILSLSGHANLLWSLLEELLWALHEI